MMALLYASQSKETLPATNIYGKNDIGHTSLSFIPKGELHCDPPRIRAEISFM